MHSHSRRQKVVATSSGAAEFYAMAGTAEELCLFSEIFTFLGYSVDLELLTDSAAAKGMASRVGLGAAKYLETKSLWLQDLVKRKFLRITKVDGKDAQPADLGTKPFTRADLVRLRRMCGVVVPGDPVDSDPDPEIASEGALRALRDGRRDRDRCPLVLALVQCIEMLMGSRRQQATRDFDYRPL